MKFDNKFLLNQIKSRKESTQRTLTRKIDKVIAFYHKIPFLAKQVDYEKMD